VPTAGEIIAGLCRDEAYRMAARGDFPVPVIKVGRRLVVPVAPILELLRIGPPETAAEEAAPPATATTPAADAPALRGARQHADTPGAGRRIRGRPREARSEPT
jgi:hypothetical protein